MPTCAEEEEEEEELCKPSLCMALLLPSAPPEGAAIISPVSGSSTIAPLDSPPDESELWKGLRAIPDLEPNLRG